ncbi:MAG TPA: YggT family protein [Patescibacteria group bacterium]|nr:YggT family protein [Patescibacteria group bacterium]
MEDVVTKDTKTIVGKGKAEKSLTTERVIYFLFGAIDVLLVFRLIFKITGANPTSGFVNLIYSLTHIFISPFAGIFHQATTTGVETTAVLEPATLVAIVVYAISAWGIVRLVTILSGRSE